MDYNLFEEMLLACKKGGYIVFSARYSMMGHYWYDKVLKEMVDDGRWELVSTDNFFKYDKLKEISIGRFSKTPSKVFVFKKLQNDISMHMDKNDKVVSKFIRQATMKVKYDVDDDLEIDDDLDDE